MGWVSIQQPGDDHIVYYGLDAAPGEGIEICDNCNEPKPISQLVAKLDSCWVCFKCHAVNQRDYK